MYYRQISKKQRRRLRIVRLILCVLLLALIGFGIDRAIRPQIRASAALQAKLVATKALNNAILTRLQGINTDYAALVKLSRDENGQITSLETDAATISMLQAEITDSVMTKLAALEQEGFTLSLGTLLNPEFLSGKGPSLHFSLLPRGYVTTRIVSSFTDAGINQTRHALFFVVSVPLAAAIPGYHTTVTVSTSYPLADTIIVGVIPEYYTKVITEDDNLVGEINDYAPALPQS